ncbi:MAG: DUF3618 domain-containing protein [Thermoanaerobaculia bacterium]
MATREDTLKRGRNRSPDEIRREIDRDREELDVTVEALQGRLAPGALAEEAWARVRRTLGGRGAGLGRAATTHPVPLALIGAGLGWLVVESASGRSISIGSSGDGNPGPTGGGSTLGKLPGRAGEIGERSGESLGRTRVRLRRNLRSNPLSSGVAALGLGVLTGLALPRTRWEDETMGETSDRAAEEARGATEEAVERGTRATREAAHSAREAMGEAAQRGEPPTERLKTGVHEAGETAREAAQEETEAAREERRRDRPPGSAPPPGSTAPTGEPGKG